MANYGVRYLIQITDVNGDVAEVSIPSYHSDTVTLAAIATTMGTFATDVAALTNGKVTRQSLHVLFNVAQYLVGTAPPNNAEYSSVTDGAKLSYSNGIGNKMSLTIPAPLESIFGANSNVVDSTNANIMTLNGDIAAHSAALGGGGDFNLYKGGVKTGKHSRKRATRLIP